MSFCFSAHYFYAAAHLNESFVPLPYLVFFAVQYMLFFRCYRSAVYLLSDTQNAKFQQGVESVENFQIFVQSNQNTKSSGEKKTRRFLHLNKFPDFAVKSLTNSFHILQLNKSAVVIIHIANGRRAYFCAPRQFCL